MGYKTGWNVRAVGLAAALVLALAGCGGGNDVSDLPGVPEGASTDGSSMDLMGKPVDACALFTPDDFTAVMKKPVEKTETMDASGSLLGYCTHTSEDFASANVSVRPAKHFDETVERYDGEKVSGVGESAYWDNKYGLFVQPAGKPYFLHIIVIPDAGDAFNFDKDLAIEVGKVAASR
ncbi:MAG TPA: hypothetical protein VFX60_08335 [Micromonospora sp.]|nr:hypothetical protein [Micromonospora sp.]